MKQTRTYVKRTALLFALALLLSVSAFAAESAPYNLALSWTDDAATTMTATWRDNAQQAEVMQVVTETEYDKLGFTNAVSFEAVCRDISLDGTGVWHYEATASGLTAGTAYVYRVGSEGSWSAPRTFTTGNANEPGVTFFYFGDIQVNSDSEAEFAAWGALAQGAYERTPEAAFALQGGDIVESGISLSQFDMFFSAAEPVFSSIPLLATNGNHESNFPDTGKPELYLDYFALPQNGPAGFEEEFYSFDYASCHILVLNSWIFSGEQRLTDADYERVNRWIAANLAASDADWQIVVTHVPVYAVHSDKTATAVKESWATIFETYGVDLVFEGHQHVYSRSNPMYQSGVNDENGITYIMGNSGQKFYDSADESFAARTVYNVSNYQTVRVDGDTLTVQALDADGNELDYISVNQRECEPAFDDVSDGAWYARAAAYVKAAGLFDGVGNNKFDPEGTMTRAMMATVLHRYAGKPEATAASAFTDVPSGQWYSEAIAWAAASELVEGYGGGVFGPDDNVTLEQMVTVLYRFNGAVVSADAALPTECGSVSSWAVDAMCWAEDNGMLTDLGSEKLASAPATRAQVAGLYLALKGVL